MNPFTLTFGKEPEEFISRPRESQEIIECFQDEKPSNQACIICGVRGSGKTVMMSNIAKTFIEDDNWIVVDLNSEKDLLEGFASELYENAKIKTLFLKKEFSFSFHGVSFSIEGDVPALTSETLIKKMLDKIKQKGKRVLITIDEVASNEYMKIFARTFQSLIRYDYPVYLLMTGLFENVSKLQNEKSLTFLYRAPKIYLGALNLNMIANSYKKIFKNQSSEAQELAKLTSGYAYAYQALGYILYKNGNSSIDDDLLVEYDFYLQEFVYNKLWSELSRNKRKILKCIPPSGEVEVKEIMSQCGMSAPYFSNYRDYLLKEGIITSEKRGYISFALPRFYEFLEDKEF